MLSALHRALVHLPIGFFLMVLIFELIARQQRKKSGEQEASVANGHKWLEWMWIVVAGSSIVALLSGTALQYTGYYTGKTFTIHQLGAYGFTLLCCLLVVGQQFLGFGKRISDILKIIILPIVILVGHAGGELSAGPEVLPMSPEPVLPILSDIDTLLIYPHVIHPIFESKCIRCHGKGNAQGGIVMDSPEALLTDSLGDPVIYPGNLKRSLGYQRMILSPWDQQYMPPSGPPITYHEKRLVEWWIMEGSPFEASLEEVNMPEDILDVLQNTLHYSAQKTAFYEKIKAAPIDSNTLQRVTDAGWNLSPLAQHNYFLDVHRKGKLDSLSIDDWQVLESIAENIVWLDLSNQSIPSQAFKLLGNMPNLYRLQLQNTNTKDENLRSLPNLEYLNTLNLFGTQITEESIPYFEKMKRLEVLYVSNTPLGEQGVDIIQQLFPEVSIN